MTKLPLTSKRRERIRDADDKLVEAKNIMSNIWEFEELLASQGIEWKPSKNKWGAHTALSQAERLAGIVGRGITVHMRRLAEQLVKDADLLEGKNELSE